MRYPRVLLVHPRYVGSFYRPGLLPTGLGYVSMALNQAGVENTVLDMDLGHDWSALRRHIQKFQPSLIGLGMMSFRYRHTYELIERIKRFFPTIQIVIGGPHVSVFRSKVLEECEAIDYGVTLEGERTIVDLCYDDIAISEVLGLLYRGPSKEVLYGGDRPLINDLDMNGFPKHSKFELRGYSGFRCVLTSRGCPYHCIYCSVDLVSGARFRTRSAQSVADEFEYWYSQGVRRLGIVDDCFTLRRSRVFEICDELERRGLSDLEIFLGNGVRVDRVDRKLLGRMREVGFCYIAFGVEGGNNKVLKGLKKGITIAVIERAIADACDLDYRVVLFFLLGSPGETQADIEDSVRLALKYPVYDVTFNNLVPLPGTELYRWVADNEYFVQGGDYLQDTTQRINNPVFETPQMPFLKRKILYRWASRTVALHSLAAKRKVHYPEMIRKLGDRGLPSSISQSLASLYWSRPFHLCFRQTGFLDKSKRTFFKSNILSL